MKVRIVNYETQSWILSKFASRLQTHLSKLGVDVDVAQRPNRRADINHHIIYQNYDGRRYSTDSLMLTHFEFPWEMEMARVQLQNAALGVCMSERTREQLVQAGFPRQKLIVAHPGHDGAICPRPIVIGLTTRLYKDGRKREHLLQQVAAHLQPERFRFRIMGDGWAEIVKDLRKQGFQVEYWRRFDYRLYCELMPALDYYMYLGQDEGSMGFLDALAAGVPTIVTPQGFHLDIPDGITHPFETLDDLISILIEIDRDHRKRSDLVTSWTWENYARKHLEAWTEVLEARETSHQHREDLSVVQRVRELGRGCPAENLRERLYRILFCEGPIRVGRRVFNRWVEAVR